MKRLWFHLMPDAELQDDFAEKHASVWVEIDSRPVDPLRAYLLYNKFMDELEHAAELGFDGICASGRRSRRRPHGRRRAAPRSPADFESIVECGDGIVGGPDEVAQQGPGR